MISICGLPAYSTIALKTIKVVTGAIRVNSLPKDKVLDCFKLKAFVDDKINVT